MVRVISVHHFVNQNIQVVEQPTAYTIAPPHRLLLALGSHCIEVRDLKNDSEVLFQFPTVDEVIKLVHCLNGDYVATLENKINRQNKRANSVRVYVNWDSVATLQQSKMTSSGVSLGSSECGMVQPMRARIAGRVTPTTNQSELRSLEMIEIPVNGNPIGIACCQMSGNILIQCSNILNIYVFQVKTHDISKLKFIDFEELPVMIELQFVPTSVDFCENYIGCMSKENMHLFKVVVSQYKEVNLDNIPLDDCDFRFNYIQDDSPIHYKKALKEEALNMRKDKMTVRLHSIVKENSVVHRHSPFTFSDKELRASVKLTSPMDDGKTCFGIVNLIQLKLRPIVIESAHKQLTEEFKSFILKPLYVDQSINKSGTHHEFNKFLRSDYRSCLNGVVCLVATLQEGYLYQFSDLENMSNEDNCISVYPFTAPVQKIVMEDYFLHALTETGLETYTLRSGHQLCRNLDVIDDVNVACPPVTDSICLVGLRPFLGVEQMLLCPNYLVLLTSSESSPTHSVSSNSSSNTGSWTLYNLQLPTPNLIFNDISIVANMHRFTSAQTYRHLVSEAHMILRLSLLLKKWMVTESNVALVVPKKNNFEDWVTAYRTSCALLGDHFIMCPNESDYVLAVPYYKMAIVTPCDVLKRVKSIQEQSNSHNIKGLLHYLKTILLDMKFGTEAEKFFNIGSRQNFVDAILELFDKYNYNDLPYLILKSRILREYSAEKLINVLSNNLERESSDPQKQLALVLLHLQRCNTNKSEAILERIPKEKLYELLHDNWELLFEPSSLKVKGATTFSDLTVLLTSVHPEILSELLAVLIDTKMISLQKALKVFLEYLPSSIGSDNNNASQVLQQTLEIYFKKFFSKQENVDIPIVYDRATHDAMKLLVRSYLSQLQILQLKEKSVDKGKGRNRYNYENVVMWDIESKRLKRNDEVKNEEYKCKGGDESKNKNEVGSEWKKPGKNKNEGSDEKRMEEKPIDVRSDGTYTQDIGENNEGFKGQGDFKSSENSEEKLSQKLLEEDQAAKRNITEQNTRNLEVKSANLGTKPINVETKFVNLETKSDNLETKSTNLETRPVNIQVRPINADTRPNTIETKPGNIEINLNNVESKPIQERRKFPDKSRFYFEDRDPKPDTFLFSHLRFDYLDKMPPFQVEITSKLYETCIEDYTPAETFQPNVEADLVLKKLQALFCSQIIPKQVLVEANTFLSLNENLRGNLSLQSLIMNVNDAVLFLIDVCPQCVLQYGKDRFTKNDEWKFLIATIQRRILRLSQNQSLNRICFFHKKLLRDVLTHAATTMSFEQLLQIFPQKLTRSYQEEADGCESLLIENRMLIENSEEPNNSDILNEIQDYEPYITICKETMHANQIKKMITATAQKLLTTLNL